MVTIIIIIIIVVIITQDDGKSKEEEAEHTSGSDSVFPLSVDSARLSCWCFGFALVCTIASLAGEGGGRSNLEDKTIRVKVC